MDYLYGPGHAGGSAPAGEQTRLEFQIKETQIEQLEAEVRALRGAGASASGAGSGLAPNNTGTGNNSSNAGVPPAPLSIPSSVDGVFARLAAALAESEARARDATAALEAALAADAVGSVGAMSNRATSRSESSADTEATAHRVLTRLEALSRENQELARMLAYGRAQQAAVQLQLLRRENAALRRENAALRRGD
ncbi:Mum2 protein [Maudiozyma humilis]|uniref:Mum2 protein n=1 Tax=Maudiozyma humilis TaxID=51915 RepID=A0AAV5S2H4_MAUHU|nr:Mum2 protein [Kazachstania humilis]